MTLEGSKDEYDIVVLSNDIEIVYNSGLEEFVGNAVVDYAQTFFQRGFFIRGTGLSSC